MGLEASCTASFGTQRGAGKALLETTEIIFRGPFRLKIPFASIRRADAARGILTVAFNKGVATFDLGKAAEVWALKIRYPKPLIDKIGVLPGMRVRLVGSHLGVGDDGFWRDLRARAKLIGDNRAGSASRRLRPPRGLGPAPARDPSPRRERAGVGPSQPVSTDVVLFFVKVASDLDRLPSLRDEMAQNGSIWVVYPKGIQAIREADVRSAGRRHGLVDVKIASFSDAHSAMKLVIPKALRRTNAPATKISARLRPSAP